MKIQKKELKQIIQKNLQFLTEDNNIYSSPKDSEDIKNIAIISEFFSSFINKILTYKAPNYKLQIGFIAKNLIQIEPIINKLNAIQSVNPKVIFIKKIIQSCIDLFENFSTNIQTLADPSDIKQLYNTFYGQLLQKKEDVLKVLNYSRTMLNANPTADLEKDTSSSKTPLEHIETFSQIEKLSFVYLSEVEILFKKIASIKQEIEESNKPWEEYDLFNQQNLAKQYRDKFNQITPAGPSDGEFEVHHPRHMWDLEFRPHKEKKEKEYPNPSRHLEHGLSMAYGKGGSFDKPVPPRKKFNSHKFLNFLYKKGELTTNPFYENEKNSIEFSKAVQVINSLKKIKKYKEDFDAALPEIFKNLTQQKNINKNNQLKIIALHNDVKKILDTVKKVDSLRKEYMNSFFNALEKEDKDILLYLKNKSFIIQLFIRFIQFEKMDIKNIFLKIISGGKAQARTSTFQNYSKEDEEKTSKRIKYWNLFMKLGWVEDEMPEWIHGTTS
jgi:hypothetical protein